MQGRNQGGLEPPQSEVQPPLTPSNEITLCTGVNRTPPF